MEVVIREAFVAVFVLTGLVAAVGESGSGTLGRRFSLLGLVVFEFEYPAVFATLGAGVVYLQRGPTENSPQA
jgi:hypothetical protein